MNCGVPGCVVNHVKEHVLFADAVAALQLNPGDVILVDRNRVSLEMVQSLSEQGFGSGFFIFVDCFPGQTPKDAMQAIPKSEVTQILQMLADKPGQ